MLLKASLWNTYLSIPPLCCSSHSVKSPFFFSRHHFPPLSPLAPHTLSSRQVTWLRLSAFFCFTAGGAVIKACQWETWVALSHALCLPSVNSPQPLAPSLLTPPPQPTTSLSSLSFSHLIAIFLPLFLHVCVFSRDAIMRNSSKRCTHMHAPMQAHARARIYTIYICKYRRLSCIVCPAAAAAANQPLLFFSKPAGCMKISFLYTKHFSVRCLFVSAHRARARIHARHPGGAE